MSDMDRLLDLDAISTFPVKFGGREYVIQPQRQAVLAKVLAFAHTDPKPVEENESSSQHLADILFSQWDEGLPIFALILGCEDDGAQKECVEHLKTCLTIPAALTIYEKWWEVNRIQDFFNRGGRLTLPPYVVEALAQATEETEE